MAKRKRQVPRKLDPYLYKGKSRSPARQEYNRELIRLYNRAKSWKYKYGFEIELPQLPDKARKEYIESLKSIVWKNLTDVDRLQADYARKHPEIGWEKAEKYKWRGEALQIVAETHEVTPRLVANYEELRSIYDEQQRAKASTEDVSDDDFSETEWVDSGGTGTKKNYIPVERTEPVVTEQEMDAFLNDLIEECCYYWDKVYTHSNYWSYRHNMLLAEEYSQKIRWAFNDLLNQSNKKKVYEYLSRPEVTAKLREDVNNLYGKESDDRNGTGHEYYFMRILDTLNGGPLTDEQMQQYQEYGTFDFSNFDEYD